jgi:23S rRNA pseudouridine1911/1915/1917 synthase
MQTPESLTVTDVHAGDRLDKFLATQFPERSRGAWQDIISAGQVTLNGRETTPHHKVKAGDAVAIVAELPAPSVIEPNTFVVTPRPDIPVRVVLDDPAFVVIEKPAGLLMHPAIATDDATLAHAAIAVWPAMASVGESPVRPGIMQRLDKEASGLVVLAKTAAAYDSLKQQFQAHTITKEYLVLVAGTPGQESGTVRLAVGRKAGQGRMSARPATLDSDRPAITHYEVEERFVGATLLRVRTETGRTHQIRVHMKALGCAVAGDELYGTPGARKLSPRLFLHATTLGFTHPTTGEAVLLTSPLPPELEAVLAKLRAK